jgi:nicotinamidase-related amidase
LKLDLDPSKVAVLSIDMQSLFTEPRSPWGRDNLRTVDGVQRSIAPTIRIFRAMEAMGKLDHFIFTRFIPSDRPNTGKGAWSHYYSKPNNEYRVTASELEAEGLDVAYMCDD